MEGISRALVLGLVLIAGTYIEQAPSVGYQVFVLLMLFLCGIVHTMWSVKSLQFICILLLSSVYSPFSNRVGLPPHNTPFSAVLMKSIGAAIFTTTCVECSVK